MHHILIMPSANLSGKGRIFAVSYSTTYKYTANLEDGR